jgi:hypothetical protein
VAASFDLAANAELAPSYPQIPSSTGVSAIPPSVLKAVGWVESGWRQFRPDGRPLLSPDFGYGIMQITSGMAGAFGDVRGSTDSATQSQIASNYTYNIAYGARMLAEKWANVPQIGNGDPTVVEHWYYALWAYNGWGWANNPNNPRFSRQGTPASEPAAFPYQERVLYLVAHPPKDANGNPLWKPVPVTLPSRKAIGTTPGQLKDPAHVHHQRPPALAAVYQPSTVKAGRSGTTEAASVRVTNTGTETWSASGTSAVSLVHHVVSLSTDPWKKLSPTTAGVVAFSQGPTALPHDLPPGKSVTLKTDVTLPGTPGHFRVVWDLEEASGEWFSQQGVEPRAQPLLVLRAGQAAPTPTPSPTSAASQQEDLAYVSDTSIPDGVTVRAGSRHLKGWLVFNSGSVPWGPDWALHHVSGPSFGATTIPVPATKPCHSANIVAALRMPKKTGHVTGVWRLQDPTGKPVGDRLTIVVLIAGRPGKNPTPTPGLGPTSTPTVRKKPTATPTPVG